MQHRITWTSSTGQKFDESIPDIWLAGFCTKNRCTVEDAIAYWRSQSELGALAPSWWSRRLHRSREGPGATDVAFSGWDGYPPPLSCSGGVVIHKETQAL